MSQGKKSASATTAPAADFFSLAVAARALAASTVSYLEPQSRGMTFAAYDAIVKDALLPPFSGVEVSTDRDRCGRDISSKVGIDIDNDIDIDADNDDDEIARNDDSVERPSNEDGENATTDRNYEVNELLERFKGDYELYEKYDRSGKQKVRCLIAVVHGRVRKRTVKIGEGTSASDAEANSAKDLEFLPGSISMTYRGTDTLENVIADVKALTVQYDDPPFIPSGIRKEECHGSEMKMKHVTVHNGFRDAWYGDELRQTTLQYAHDKLEELKQEVQEAQHIGLAIDPSIVNGAVLTIDIVGHSLGGSIAVLAAFDLAKSLHYIASSSSKQAHIRVYTMGCPRVGNVQFTKLFNQLVPTCWNIINDNDIVPAIPYSATMLRSRLPVICPCKETGYKRHGKAVILKDDGNLFVNPSRRVKYRREAEVLRLKKAVDCHKTSSYRRNLRAAIRKETDAYTSKSKQLPKKHQEGSSSIGGLRIRSSAKRKQHQCSRDETGLLEAVDNRLDRLGLVIDEALSDPNRSFRLLPGGT